LIINDKPPCPPACGADPEAECDASQPRVPAKTNGPALRESGPRPFYAEGCPINPHPDTLSWY
jgi:hypothetical protein